MIVSPPHNGYFRSFVNCVRMIGESSSMSKFVIGVVGSLMRKRP